MNVFEKCNMCLQRIHVGYSLNNFSLLSVKIIKQRTRFLQQAIQAIETVMEIKPRVSERINGGQYELLM